MLVTCVVTHGPRYAAFIELIYVRLLSASGQCIIRASSRGTVRSVQLLLTPWLCTSHARQDVGQVSGELTASVGSDLSRDRGI
jgi:hypothetical protein